MRHDPLTGQILVGVWRCLFLVLMLAVWRWPVMQAMGHGILSLVHSLIGGVGGRLAPDV